jgi:Tfp pilus assembly protein FimT
MQAGVRRSRRPLTLIEIFVVLALIGLMAGVASWSLTGLLAQGRFQSEVGQFKSLLQELQVEALALGSDLQVSLYKEKGVWKARSRTCEKILRDRTIELKTIDKVAIDNIPVETKATLNLLSTGRLSKEIVLSLSGKRGEVWIDFRRPLPIKFYDKRPHNPPPEEIPAKPKKE